MTNFYRAVYALVVINSLKASESKFHKRKKSSSCSTQHACEKYTLQLSCKSNDVIKIESALYGRTTYSVCNGRWPHSRNCRAPSAFDIVSERCKGFHSCDVYASNSVFGDPCKFTYKYLEVKFCCMKKEDKIKGHTSTINAQTISIGRSETGSEVSSYSELDKVKTEGTSITVDQTSSKQIDHTTAEGQKKESSDTIPSGAANQTKKHGVLHCKAKTLYFDTHECIQCPRNNSVITTIVITVACLIVTMVILSVGVAAYKFKKGNRNQEERVNSTSQVTNETQYVDNDDYDVMRIRRAHRHSAEDQADGGENGFLSNDYAMVRKQGTEMADTSCSNEYGTSSSDYAFVGKQGTQMSAEYDEVNRREISATSTAENTYGVAHGQQFGNMDTVPVQNEYAVAYTCKRGTDMTSILTDGDEYAAVNRKERLAL